MRLPAGVADCRLTVPEGDYRSRIRIGDSRSGMRDPECEIRDSRSGIRDPGFEIEDEGLRIKDRGLDMCNEPNSGLLAPYESIPADN